ncbi:VTC domain-containing protein [Serinicoccus sp. CNJ-927]|uniref:VTC domain-containing protein n=1 Tax=Serinicoccus sp. CNJ-927 TaxID=1904970 RepID=UPI000A4A9286|nr:VTC domain-containing protein [Serinicoccus sp. CNJ-927]
MSPLASLSPISLTDLVAESALLTRVDRKYLLTTAQVDAALVDVPAGTRVLEIEGLRRFDYASTYFDTEDRQSYRSTATARRRRWKVRTRSYLDTGTCWLEVKTRGPRGTTVKARQPHPVGMPAALTADAAGFVERTLRDQGVPLPRDGWDAAPALDTAYRRTTLALADAPEPRSTRRCAGPRRTAPSWRPRASPSSRPRAGPPRPRWTARSGPPATGRCG